MPTLSEPVPATSPVSTEAKRERFYSLDLLRAFSACGVVWFHTEGAPLKEYRPGFISFVLIAVILQTYGADKYTFGTFWSRRAKRILIPWAVWFMVYGVLSWLRKGDFFPYSTGVVNNLLTGPWIGLWFLPFILFASVAVFFVYRTAAALSKITLGVVSVAVGCLTLYLVFRERAHHAIEPPWAQWLYALPAFPIGLGYAQFIRIEPRKRVPLLLASAVTVFAVCAFPLHFTLGTWPYAIGACLVSLALLIRVPHRPWIVALSEQCMGVYLTHALFLTAYKIVLGDNYHYLPVFLLTTLSSFGLVYLLHKIPAMRHVM